MGWGGIKYSMNDVEYELHPLSTSHLSLPFEIMFALKGLHDSTISKMFPKRFSKYRQLKEIDKEVKQLPKSPKSCKTENTIIDIQPITPTPKFTLKDRHFFMEPIDLEQTLMSLNKISIREKLLYSDDTGEQWDGLLFSCVDTSPNSSASSLVFL